MDNGPFEDVCPIENGESISRFDWFLEKLPLCTVGGEYVQYQGAREYRLFDFARDILLPLSGRRKTGQKCLKGVCGLPSEGPPWQPWKKFYFVLLHGPENKDCNIACNEEASMRGKFRAHKTLIDCAAGSGKTVYRMLKGHQAKPLQQFFQPLLRWMHRCVGRPRQAFCLRLITVWRYTWSSGNVWRCWSNECSSTWGSGKGHTCEKDYSHQGILDAIIFCVFYFWYV